MNLTTEEKSKALRRVIYSIHMVASTYQYLTNHQDRNVAYNCHLESFLTHTRSLNYFFSKKKVEDDIAIEDFTDDFKNIDIDTKINFPINKYLAHLTSYKINEKALWDLNQSVEVLFPLCKKFLSHKLFNDYNLEVEVEETKKNLIQYFLQKMKDELE